MGMYLVDGQLHLLNNPDKLDKVKKVIKQTSQSASQPTSQSASQQTSQSASQQTMQTGYIYNKYFNNEPTNVPNVRTPKTLIEYRNMLIDDIIQKHRIRQIKNTKLIMPNSNINFFRGGGDMNQLFKFSNR
jgi:hypothetical protein